MSKALVFIYMPGGMDGINFITPRDSAAVAALGTYRASSLFDPINFTDSLTKTGSLTAGSATLTVNNNTSLTVGMNVYSEDIKATDNVLIDNISGTTVTLNKSVVTGFSEKPVKFKESLHLYKLDETITGKNYGFNFTQKLMTDLFNVPDTVPNASKVKAGVVVGIGTLRKPLQKRVGGPNAGELEVTSTGNLAVLGIDYHQYLTSHNSQQDIVNSTTATVGIGVGGGVADKIIPTIPAAKNKNLVSISVYEPTNFSIGVTTSQFTISPTSLLKAIPDYLGRFTYDSIAQPVLNTNFKTAFNLVQANDDLAAASSSVNQQLLDYQTVLGVVPEITDVPTSNINFQIAGSADNLNVSTLTFLRYLKAAARMILVNNPNRGATVTRSGTTATIQTEITVGTANRTSGSNVVTVTAANHRLFTSNLKENDVTDSVIITGADSSPPVDGYKITLDPTDVDNKFTFTSNDTTTLSNVAVNIRIKHNLATTSKVYMTNTGFDSAFPADGHQVASIINSTSFTVTTTATGAYGGTTINSKFKLINVPSQIYAINTAGIGWDTHNGTNHSQLAALDCGLTWYNSIVSRIVDADVITYSGTDFGRQVTTNSRGTDHGWATSLFYFGKSIKGNKIMGSPPSYVLPTPQTSPNFTSSAYEIPTTGMYNFHATFAKWLGLSDAEILEVFPDLINWPLNQRTLDIINY